MSNTYQIYLISDSTGETLDRIFLALKAQFVNIEYKVHSYSFTRTENQILKILEDAEKNSNAIILYTIVDNNLAKYLANESENKKIPLKEVSKSLSKRTLMDKKRKHSPLKKAKDAILIRTDILNKKMMIKKMSDAIEKKIN